MLYLNIDDVKSHIKEEITNTDIDTDLSVKITEAQGILELYLNYDLVFIYDYFGYIPDALKSVLMKITAHLWSFRGDNIVQPDFPDLVYKTIENWNKNNMYLE